MESKRPSPDTSDIAFTKGENVWWTYGVTEETGGHMRVLQGHVAETYTHDDIREIPSVKIICKSSTAAVSKNQVFTIPAEAVKRFS